MNLDYEQTFNDIDETKRLMTMKPSVETLSTFSYVIQSNVAANVLDQLIFKAEVDSARKWVLEAGFSLTTHAYDFLQKKIVEVNAPQMTEPVRKPIII
jgi:hypothetical protein|tara:strand:- start:197 stop:490 length:294 start_codon:yes stop_codon:yes gene_type:complete